MVSVSCIVGIYLIILSGEEYISVDSVTGVCLILINNSMLKEDTRVVVSSDLSQPTSFKFHCGQGQVCQLYSP